MKAGTNSGQYLVSFNYEPHMNVCMYVYIYVYTHIHIHIHIHIHTYIHTYIHTHLLTNSLNVALSEARRTVAELETRVLEFKARNRTSEKLNKMVSNSKLPTVEEIRLELD